MDAGKKKIHILKGPLTRRQFIAFLFITLGSSLMISSYGFAYETRNLKVKSINLALPKFQGLIRAVQISDLHFVKANLLMSEVSIKIWEHRTGTLKNGLEEKLKDVGIKLLINSGEIIDLPNGAFFLAGIDDAYHGSPNAVKAFKGRKRELSSIVLSHSPLGINYVSPLKPDLILSGHTHGGQIQVPFWGAIHTPPGSGKFVQGLYEINQIKMYVNRGIGTSIIPIRFMCSPEVTFLQVSGI